MNEPSDDSPIRADNILFQDILSCQAHLPAECVPDTGLTSSVQAETLLRGLELMEEFAGNARSDEHGKQPPVIQRIEAKVDVLLLLIGHLMQHNLSVPSACRLRWSARGVRLHHPHAGDFAVGSSGVLRLQPSARLPELLELPVSVLARDGEQVWLQFQELPASLTDALERHLFRQHRREIAHARRRPPQ